MPESKLREAMERLNEAAVERKLPRVLVESADLRTILEALAVQPDPLPEGETEAAARAYYVAGGQDASIWDEHMSMDENWKLRRRKQMEAAIRALDAYCWCGQSPAVIRYRDLRAAARFRDEIGGGK